MKFMVSNDQYFRYQVSRDKDAPNISITLRPNTGTVRFSDHGMYIGSEITERIDEDEIEKRLTSINSVESIRTADSNSISILIRRNGVKDKQSLVEEIFTYLHQQIEETKSELVDEFADELEVEIRRFADPEADK